MVCICGVYPYLLGQSSCHMSSFLTTYKVLFFYFQRMPASRTTNVLWRSKVSCVLWRAGSREAWREGGEITEITTRYPFAQRSLAELSKKVKVQVLKRDRWLFLSQQRRWQWMFFWLLSLQHCQRSMLLINSAWLSHLSNCSMVAILPLFQVFEHFLDLCFLP